MSGKQFFIPVALLGMFLLLSACRTTDWVHPNIADPRKQDRAFEEDSTRCTQELNETYSDSSGNAEARTDLFEKCMKAKGWEQQDWW